MSDPPIVFFDGFIARFICSMIYSIQCGLSKNGREPGQNEQEFAHAPTEQA
jgi:hypothetical protein